MAAMGPSAGKLRERVRFDRRAPVSDGMGNTVGPWATLIAARYAQLTPARGGEQVIAARLQGVATFDLVLRYDSQTQLVTTDDRVVALSGQHIGGVFDIVWIDNLDERRKFLWAIVRQGAAEG